MYKHRFPRGFIWLITATGSGVLLFSIYGLPISKLGIPFLILVYIAIKSASRPLLMVANERFAVPITETLVFLSMLVFDGEAAILFAAVTALCVSFRESKEPKFLLFYSLFSAAATGAVVWAIRAFVGPIQQTLDNPFTLRFVELIIVGALLQSILQSTLFVIGESYKVKQSHWRTLLSLDPGLFALNIVGIVAAGLVALWIGVLGLTAGAFFFGVISNFTF